ncbi:uncharacterized protein LOC117112745 [Anneissia japonica]|uniref:uncharacterized protein LOC117112745 n=1 Tax=Anneissia japonica TaxID=1529436 RepID=UPI00142559AE|nr:uncharacterized protein LOC117112745 [Anneissia japonica]
MFGDASPLSPHPVLFLTGIGLMLSVYPQTIPGFCVWNTTNPSEERKSETPLEERSANNAASRKAKRHGVGLTNTQSNYIREQKMAMQGSNDYQPVLINITNEQQADILAIYGSYFEKENSLQETQEQMAFSRVARAVVEVCPRITSWDEVTLVRSADGRYLQVVQLPDEDLKQWILQESCQNPVSNVINNVSCEKRERLVRAVVIDPDIMLINAVDVVVYCCAAYTTL